MSHEQKSGEQKSGKKVNWKTIAVVILAGYVFFVGGRAARHCMGSHDGFWESFLECFLKLEVLDHINAPPKKKVEAAPEKPKQRITCDQESIDRIISDFKKKNPGAHGTLLCFEDGTYSIELPFFD